MTDGSPVASPSTSAVGQRTTSGSDAGSASIDARESERSRESATDDPESDRSRESSTDSPDLDDPRVLVVTGLSRKNDRHFGPLADVADETTLVCLDPAYDIESANYVRAPEVGPRIVRIVLLLFVALYEGYRNEYDAVASISLVPYGFYALALKAAYGYPAHLGIIGIDIDHHARQWYGAVPRWAFGRFDAVSVPGSVHADLLARFGVPADRIEILTNAIDVDTYRPPADDVETAYEFVWVGRFSEEKAPGRFVDALAELDAAGREFRAVMVGDGPLREDVAADLAARGLAERVALPGWVDEPVRYYRRSEVFVLTSTRDALPLAMLEAMATGLVAVVPRVGSIPDVVTDGENGVVVHDRRPDTFAAAMERCLDDDEFRRAVAANATAVRGDVSMERASDDWRRILTTLTS